MTTSPDEPSSLDVERILATLDRHHVEYLVVGGISTQLHGALRPTKDHDALPELRTLNEVLTEKGLSARAREIMRSDRPHREPPDAGLSL